MKVCSKNVCVGHGQRVFKSIISILLSDFTF